VVKKQKFAQNKTYDI